MHPGTTPTHVFRPAAEAAGPKVIDAMGKRAMQTLVDAYRRSR
jgi:hypothetical protein